MYPNGRLPGGTGCSWPVRVASLATAVAIAAAPAKAAETGFAQAYEAAIAHDPAYRAALHARDAMRLQEPIARAALLPVVALNLSTAEVDGTRGFTNAINQDVRVRVEYQSPQAALSVRVPLLNVDGIAGMSLAQAQIAVAEEQFRLERIDLVDRLAEASFQLLAAQETARLLARLVESRAQQLAQAVARLAGGEGTRVQVAQAQAVLEIDRSRSIEADNQLAVARQAVTRITGLVEPSVPRLPETPSPVPLQPVTLAEWLGVALRSSPSLRLREQALEVARVAVLRQQAGHFPRLDAVGSLSRQESDGVANIGQRTTLKSIGVQLSVPLFSGGGVDASVRQARARQFQAEEELRQERENLQFDVTRLWQAVRSSAARMRALAESQASGAIALRGAERALAEGLGVAAEVADVRAAAIETERQMLLTRVEHLRSRIRLQLRAGVVDDDVVADLDRSWRLPGAVNEGSAGP